MLLRFYLSVVLFLFISSCAGVGLVHKSKEEIYTPAFLNKMERIKNIYLSGNNSLAIQELLNYQDPKFKEVEKSYKNNLLGVIFFNMGQFDKSISYFKLALNTSKEDPTLESQVFLNISSSYFKKGEENLSRETLSMVDPRYLSEDESAKYYKLRYLVFQNSPQDSLFSLVNYFNQYKNFSKLRVDELFPRLSSSFFKLDSESRIDFLYQFEGKSSLATVYLAGLEVEKRFYNGDKDRAQSILGWLKRNFSFNEEYNLLIDSINYRISNFSKINMNVIGVVLPLSGPKAKFARKLLQGLETSLNYLNRDGSKNIKFVIKDDRGEAAVGEKVVEELVKKYSVPVIIGGLFSDEASEEYLMAKKYGVMFISLSEVYLKDVQKDFLLVEVPGSVESQIEKILQPENIQRLGNKAALIYSEDKRGQAYFSRFWKKAAEHGVEIKALQSHPKNAQDYRSCVRKLLSLEFKRERDEEYALLERIYELKGSGSARRIQTLSPVVDFNWVFAPSFPDEAIRLIPTFYYFDAGRIPFVGIPAWRSQSVIKISSKAHIYFVGDDSNVLNEDAKQFFYLRNSSYPSFLEVMAHNAGNVAFSLISSPASNRNEFHNLILSKKDIEIPTGKWTLHENLWLKDLKMLSIDKGTISTTYGQNQIN